MGHGLFGTAMQYNIFAVSCLGFVSQIEHAPAELLKKETNLLQKLTVGPYNAISCNALVNLRDLGMPLAFRSVQGMNLAAMFRTAHTTSKHWREALAEYNCMLLSDDITIDFEYG